MQPWSDSGGLPSACEQYSTVYTGRVYLLQVNLGEMRVTARDALMSRHYNLSPTSPCRRETQE